MLDEDLEHDFSMLDDKGNDRELYNSAHFASPY